MIAVTNLSFSYGARSVLSDVSLTVKAGEVVGLVGPNGAGKTTLMRAIGTLLPISRGTITVARRDVCTHPHEARKAIGFFPERANLYPELLVWEYLDLFAEIAGHG